LGPVAIKSKAARAEREKRSTPDGVDGGATSVTDWTAGRGEIADVDAVEIER